MTSTQLTLADRTSGLVGSVIDSSTSLLAAQQHDIVRFAMGAPSDDLMPVALLDQLLAQSAPGKYSYGATEGEARLIDQICVLQRAEGIEADPARITVTTGGMQGLDIACKLFVNPGDLVVVEGPTYTNGNATALSYGAELLEVPVDQDGLDVEAMADLVARAGRRPAVIYTIPNFQNPSGVTLSLPRREKLLELAARWGTVIIDDDPYGMLRFDNEPVPSLREISPNNPQIFSVRTFSKILAPGLRVGWIDADPQLRRLIINAKQAMDTCTAVPAQQGVSLFLEGLHLSRHLDYVKDLYRYRKNAMRQALEKYFGDSIVATDPDGGFFLWVTFKDATINTEQLFETALACGVAYIPGPAFSAGANYSNALRLCFATSTPERIDEGVRRLEHAVATWKDK